MAADTTTSRAPDFRFLTSHPAHFIALGFGVGLIRFAPGTWGTLLGWGIYCVLALFLPPLFVAVLTIPLLLLGIWACDVTGRNLGVPDHGSMVIDEVVAFLPLAAVAFASVWFQLLAFLLFRLFDIWKPFPIRQVEAAVKGGLGVMIDDLMAGFYAYLVFVLFIIVMHKGLGFQ